MARRKRKSLGNATACKLSSDAGATSGCVTEKGATFCVGDRVKRSLKGLNSYPTGTIVAIGTGYGNTSKKPKASASVCFDDDLPKSLAYSYLYGELKKAR